MCNTTATAYLWEAVHLFHAPGSERALKMMKLLVLALLSGLSEVLVIWLETVAAQMGLSCSQRQRLAKICTCFRNNQPRLTSTWLPVTRSPPG